MIVLCGIPSEPPLALVLHELVAMGKPHAVVNQRLSEDYGLSFEVSDGVVRGALDLAGAVVPLDQVRSVYARQMDDRDLPEVREEPADSPRRRRIREFHAALEEWLELTPALVLTRAGPNASNGSKTFQAAVAAAHGFAVPETLVTNDPQAVLVFREQAGRVVYKSVSGTRSIVTELADDDLGRLDAIRLCPVQFQQAVDGTDVRVHVVGDEVFATAVVSQAVDYRYGESELATVALEAGVAERCIALAQALELPFAGVDLRIAPDGTVYCLEVNPSPAYSFYEAATGQPIAQAVARLLARG